jgi:hypothetical protein
MEGLKMKKLIIDDAHKAEIEQALKDGQKRARERRIDTLEELIDEIETAKHDCNLPSNLPKKSWECCTLTIRIGAGHFANAYRYAPEGSVAVVKFRKDGLGELVDVYRDYCKDKKPYAWCITEQMRNYIMAEMQCEVIKNEK